MAKPEIIVEIKTYADGALVAQSAKVVKPDLDWFTIIVLAVVLPCGLWAMTMGGVFG